MQIHVDRGGQRFGPYSLEDVNRYLTDGTLLPSDLGWHDGMADWKPLTQVSGVVAGGGAPTPPGPPAPTAADAATPIAPPPAGGKKTSKGLKIALGVVGGLAVVGGIGFAVWFFFFKGPNDAELAAASWHTLPNGAPILGGADVVAQIKVGEIFKSALLQQQLEKEPNAGMVIGMMQQLVGIGPGDLQDLTISLSGISALAQSSDDPDKALENAYKSGKIKYSLVLRASKPIDKAKIEELLTQGGDKPDFNPAGMEEKKHGEAKYYLFKNDNPPEPDYAAYLADEKTLVFGLESVIQSHIDIAGNIPARPGLEFLDTKQQITIAYLPPDNKAIETAVTKALAEMEIPPEAPQQLQDIAQTAKVTLESLKKVEAAALSVGLTESGLQLVASANFADPDASKGFADNFNKLLAEGGKIPQAAQFLLIAQGAGLQIPSAESKEKQAKLSLTIPMEAIESFEGLNLAGNGNGGNDQRPGEVGPFVPSQPNGSARHSQVTLKRWNLLKQTVGRNQWPPYTVVGKANNMGQANNVEKNVVMDVRTVKRSGAVIQMAANITQVPGCMRWDYFDTPQGQRAIHLYFNDNNGQLIGVHWFEAGPRKIGIPGGGGEGPGNRPNGPRPPGGQKGGPGGNSKGGFRPKGSRPKDLRPKSGAGQTVSNAPPQSAAEAQQQLKGTWISTTRDGSRVTLTFGDNNLFGTDSGSGPKRGKYRILSVSGNSITFTGLNAMNIVNIVLNGANEFTVNQTSMVGVIPKGTFKRK